MWTSPWSQIAGDKRAARACKSVRNTGKVESGSEPSDVGAGSDEKSMNLAMLRDRGCAHTIDYVVAAGC